MKLRKKHAHEYNDDVSNPPSEVAIENDGDESEVEDYDYLILNPNQFKKGTLPKGKDIVQDDDHDA